MQPICPICIAPLVSVGRASTRCPDHHGTALSWDALARALWARDALDPARLAGEGAPTHRVCPNCRGAMTRATIRTLPTFRVDVVRVARGVPLELDLCAPCRLVWLDAGELTQLVGPLGPSDAPMRRLDDWLRELDAKLGP